MKPGITIEAFILEGMLAVREATGAFTSLLNQIVLGCKLISAQVRRAGLADVLGYTGRTNVHGERVQKLDQLANETLLAVLARHGHCAAAASEELEDVHVLNDGPEAKYLVVFDPLDGSSNIDVAGTIGTIFGVLRREGGFLRPGRELIAAGYCLYGSSTLLVLTTGSGVHGFTYDPSCGEFFLSHENIRTPASGDTYSINEGNAARWPDGVRRWNEQIKREGRSLRYVGSLVADAHRTLLTGGIFAYPGEKLRLLYEANPMAFVFEAAGGSTNGVLDVVPSSLHQRIPLVLGSVRDVETFLRA